MSKEKEIRRHQVHDFLRIGPERNTSDDGTGMRGVPPRPGPHTPLPLIDVRSPGEFARGHIPGAENIPLFSDVERAEVGTLYKRQGYDAAVLQGLAFVGPKLESLARQVLALCGRDGENGPEAALYCERGGMRSGSVAWLLQTAGCAAHILEGGYRRFRRYVLDLFEKPHNLRVLGGSTGSGKTEALHCMAREGVRIVDIEGLARHRGSAFGWLPDCPQPSQEHFENLLAMALDSRDPEIPIWVEDECENLGRINLPKPLYRQLRAAPLVLLEVPDAARLARVLEEYGHMPPEEMGQCLDRIRKRLGGLAHKQAHACLAQKDLAGLARILLDYYDRAYAKQLNGRRTLAVVRAASAQAAAPLLSRAGQAEHLSPFSSRTEHSLVKGGGVVPPPAHVPQ